MVGCGGNNLRGAGDEDPVEEWSEADDGGLQERSRRVWSVQLRLAARKVATGDERQRADDAVVRPTPG